MLATYFEKTDSLEETPTRSQKKRFNRRRFHVSVHERLPHNHKPVSVLNLGISWQPVLARCWPARVGAWVRACVQWVVGGGVVIYVVE